MPLKVRAGPGGMLPMPGKSHAVVRRTSSADAAIIVLHCSSMRQEGMCVCVVLVGNAVAEARLCLFYFLFSFSCAVFYFEGSGRFLHFLRCVLAPPPGFFSFLWLCNYMHSATVRKESQALRCYQPAFYRYIRICTRLEPIVAFSGMLEKICKKRACPFHRSGTH